MSVAAVDAAFRAADAALADCQERRLVIAGFGVQLRFANPLLGVLFDAAFAHLAGVAPVDLVVTVVVGESAVQLPLELCANHGDGAHALHDFANGRCLQVIPDVAKIPTWAAASPLRTILGTFFASRGRYLMHAAAIGGLLLAAKGGSGKSTCALACLESGALRVAGDDFVVLEPDATRVHSLFGTAKIGRAHSALFPRLERLAVRDGGPLDDPAEKAVLRLFPALADRLARELPVRAIAVPALGLERAESRVEPLTRADALLALAPSSIFLVPGAGTETMAVLAALVASVPVYRFVVGNDVRGIPGALAGLLASVTAERASV